MEKNKLHEMDITMWGLGFGGAFVFEVRASFL